jgi:hypothetical protein
MVRRSCGRRCSIGRSAALRHCWTQPGATTADGNAPLARIRTYGLAQGSLLSVCGLGCRQLPAPCSRSAPTPVAPHPDAGVLPHRNLPCHSSVVKVARSIAPCAACACARKVSVPAHPPGCQAEIGCPAGRMAQAPYRSTCSRRRQGRQCRHRRGASRPPLLPAPAAFCGERPLY